MQYEGMIGKNGLGFAQQPLGLRRLEYGLLLHLAREPERVHTKHELLRNVWGYSSPGTTRTVPSTWVPKYIPEP